ncbi:MAG TPA: NUDIX domain-containing protein [Candidatus Nanoarchaeia archaeon]
MEEDQQFYVGQKAFIEKGQELLVLHDNIVGLDFPGGKIQVGETNLEESLKREVREETGLEIEVGKLFMTWIKDMVTEKYKGKKLLLVGYKCRYISGTVLISHEHERFRWVDKNTYKETGEDQEYFKYLEAYFTGS